jgi:hypothetical protein
MLKAGGNRVRILSIGYLPYAVQGDVHALCPRSRAEQQQYEEWYERHKVTMLSRSAGRLGTGIGFLI